MLAPVVGVDYAQPHHVDAVDITREDDTVVVRCVQNLVTGRQSTQRRRRRVIYEARLVVLQQVDTARVVQRIRDQFLKTVRPISDASHQSTFHHKWQIRNVGSSFC